MASYQNREAFIPYSRQEIIELCLGDNKIAIADHQNFRDFCNILTAYYHFKLHRSLEKLKASFEPFDPDLDNYQPINQPNNVVSINQQEEDLINTFSEILRQANYYPVSQIKNRGGF